MRKRHLCVTDAEFAVLLTLLDAYFVRRTKAGLPALDEKDDAFRLMEKIKEVKQHNLEASNG